MSLYLFFFFKHPATSDPYTLSLHDALPILVERQHAVQPRIAAERQHHRHRQHTIGAEAGIHSAERHDCRSEEHTSELQSLRHLVCRLLLEKKKQEENINNKNRHKTKPTTAQ